MRRYLGILFVLIALAWVYARLGGFGPGAAAHTGFNLDLKEWARKEAPADSSSTSMVHRATDPASQESTTTSGTNGGFISGNSEEFGKARNDRWESLSIGRGQSFYVAMTSAGVSHEEIMSLVKACKPATNFRRVQSGDTFQIKHNEDGTLTAFHSELDAEHYLIATRDGNSWNTEIGAYQLERTVSGVKGTINSSLFEALVEEKADPQLATQLSEILGWDIDFFRDLRKGDQFTILYEEFTRDGKKVRDGNILAAHFVNQGREYSAYLYENKLGFPAYYDEKGGSLEKQFLRAPLKYSRISSNFSSRRYHPVHHIYRPHYGVDYAAPTGTPVYATANGTVLNRQRKGGNGNYIHLRHGNGYETYYLHLSRFARGLHVGQKVKQGDVIGFVGMTGVATGPHLDYRVKHSGKWLNPRKLDLPPAAPVEDERRPQFTQRRDSLQIQLERVTESQDETLVLDRQTTRAEIEPSGR